MRNTFILVLIAVTLMIVAAGCSQAPPAAIDAAKLKMFSPLPAAMTPKDGGISADQVALGRMLYYDTRLSKSQKLSCNSCHDLAKFGVDNDPTSEGHKGQLGDRNSPTVYNAAGHFVQFWDGRAKDVEEQAKGPVLNPVEMAMASEKDVIAVLKSIPEYTAAFKKAFPNDKDPVTYDNFGKAVGAFERGLVTPSRWDKFLAGDQSALTDAEKAGFIAFSNAGCPTCHAGTYLGGNMFQKLGLAKPWTDTSDPGRAKVTKSEADNLIFKVPGLRNIEKTGPYLHNGKTASLAEVISVMGEYQLGKQLAPEETASIETFLKSLTGTIPEEYIKPPALPKSGPKTPKPTETD